jgi:hypothetical protein
MTVASPLTPPYPLDPASEPRPMSPSAVDPTDRPALLRLLDAYFVGPFEAGVVDALAAEVAAVLADPQRHAGVIADFHPGNGGRGFGLAWREELALGRASPTALDVAAWIVWSRGVPARPYCPPAFVGIWRQLEPASGIWELGPQGELRCGEPGMRARVHWCMHRQSERGPVGDALWLDDELRISPKILLVRAASANELALQAVGSAKPVIRLVRTAEQEAR